MKNKRFTYAERQALSIAHVRHELQDYPYYLSRIEWLTHKIAEIDARLSSGGVSAVPIVREPKAQVTGNGYIFTNEMGGISFKKPEKVQVISILTGDLHPVRVKSLSSGSVYYCTEKEIQTRAAKAERKPAEMVLPEAIKKEAEKMAEQKVQEFKDSRKPTFEEVADSFYSLAEIGKLEASHARDVVISLAEKALYDRIKDGCVWEKKS